MIVKMDLLEENIIFSLNSLNTFLFNAKQSAS